MAPEPFSTAESVLLDGANSVGGAPRAGFPAASLGLAVVLGAAALTVLLRRTSRSRVGLLGLLLAGALPGGWQLATRADGPTRREPLAVMVTVALEDLASLDGGEAGLRITREDDDVLFPLGRYLWPARPPADGGLALELRGPSLTSACHREGEVVVCGVGP